MSKSIKSKLDLSWASSLQFRLRNCKVNEIPPNLNEFADQIIETFKKNGDLELLLDKITASS